MEYTLICADCKKKKTYEAKTLRRLLDNARDDGWAINRDYSRQWCPNCANSHRNVGKAGSGLKQAIDKN